jgi:tetratricopeptide (TPR) repeat protein
LTFKGKPSNAIYHFQQSLLFKPDNPEVMIWLSFAYDLVGKTYAAMSTIDRCIQIDPINPMNYALKGINHFFQGRFDLAKPPLLDMYSLVPESSMWQFWKSLVLVYNELPEEALGFIDKHIKEPAQDTIAQLPIFLKYILRGEKDKLPQLLNPEFVTAAKRDCQIAWHIASFYAYIDEKDPALDWLEIAVDQGFINYRFLDEHDRLLNSIRTEPRFKKLMERVKHEWENFEV